MGKAASETEAGLSPVTLNIQNKLYHKHIKRGRKIFIYIILLFSKQMW